MSVTREQLYEAVWAEPMTVVATRGEVSANYLARVCHHLNVPHPVRGYWAKLSFGKKPKRPTLPDARPGEVLEWMKGDSVPRVVRSSRDEEDRKSHRGTLKPRERPARHPLVAGAREFFEAGRLSEVGYLRPRKRNLVDLFVSKETLANAPWAPGRSTIVFIGTVPFGLTVYESAEHVDGRTNGTARSATSGRHRRQRRGVQRGTTFRRRPSSTCPAAVWRCERIPRTAASTGGSWPQ